MARERELTSRDAHVRRRGETGEQRGDVVIDERHEELVDIDVDEPLGHAAEHPQRVVVRGALPGELWPVEARHEAVVEVPLEERGRVVGAAVVVEEDVVDAEREVVRQPLLEVARLVADDRDDRGAEPRLGHERAAPDRVRRRLAACREVQLEQSRLGSVGSRTAGVDGDDAPART